MFRRQRRIACRLRPRPGCPRARSGRPEHGLRGLGSQAAHWTPPLLRRWQGRQRAGLRAAGHGDGCTPELPWATGWWIGHSMLFDAYQLTCKDLHAAKRAWHCRDNWEAGQLRLSALDDLGYLPQGAEESEVLKPNATAPVPHQLQPGLLHLGAHFRFPWRRQPCRVSPTRPGIRCPPATAGTVAHRDPSASDLNRQ